MNRIRYQSQRRTRLWHRGIATVMALISAVTFTTPALEDDHQLDLVLEITLSAGDPLTNNSCSWYYIDGGLTMVVG